MKGAALGAVLLLGACTVAQQDEVTQLCNVAQPLAVLTAALPVVGPYVAAGVSIGCTTAAGLAKLHADPSSADWLAQQIVILEQALGKS